MPRLLYCQQVIKEVLRLYPPIPIFPRVAAGEDVLPSGHQVVKDDVIFMSAYAMGRSDTVWDSPMTFDPEVCSRVPRHPFPFRLPVPLPS
jgi:cytochrome P450